MRVSSRRELYRGRVIKLCIYSVETPDGMKTREIVEHSGSVAVLAFLDDDHVLIERRYRAALDREIIEIPAGIIERGETVESAAVRELIEETGYKPRSIERLISFYPSPGYTNEIIHIVVARDLEYVGRPAADTSSEEKYMRIDKARIDDLLRMIRGGEIVDGKTMIAVTYYVLSKLQLK